MTETSVRPIMRMLFFTGFALQFHSTALLWDPGPWMTKYLSAGAMPSQKHLDTLNLHPGDAGDASHTGPETGYSRPCHLIGRIAVNGCIPFTAQHR